MDLGAFESRKGDAVNIQTEPNTALAWRLLHALAMDLPGDWRVQIGEAAFSVLTIRSATRWLACNPPDALPATPNQQRIARYLRDRGTDVVLQGLQEATGEDDSLIVF